MVVSLSEAVPENITGELLRAPATGEEMVTAGSVARSGPDAARAATQTGVVTDRTKARSRRAVFATRTEIIFMRIRGWDNRENVTLSQSRVFSGSVLI